MMKTTITFASLIFYFASYTFVIAFSVASPSAESVSSRSLLRSTSVLRERTILSALKGSTQFNIARSPSVLLRDTFWRNKEHYLHLMRGGELEESGGVAEDEEVLDLDDSSATVNDDAEEDVVPAVVEAPKGSPIEEVRLTPVPGKGSEDEGDSISTKRSSFCALSGAAVKPIMNFGKTYATLLASHPIYTKSVTAGVIFGFSDWMAQLIENSKEPTNVSSANAAISKPSKRNAKVSSSSASQSRSTAVNKSRLVTSILVGLCYFGPAAHYWYEWIFQVLPSTSMASTMAKAALGQLIFGPIFTCIFFATSLMQSGDFTMGNWFGKIHSDLIGIWAAGLGFWPIVDFISYKSIPVPYIPLFVNFCSFIWTIYLSLVSNKRHQES